jgi:hypothetical protein
VVVAQLLNAVVAAAVAAAGLQVLPVLPAVVPVLLEALSGMEDARLNYVEQVGQWAVEQQASRLIEYCGDYSRCSVITSTCLCIVHEWSTGLKLGTAPLLCMEGAGQ